LHYATINEESKLLFHLLPTVGSGRAFLAAALEMKRAAHAIEKFIPHFALPVAYIGKTLWRC